MLEVLHIENIAIIEEADIRFEPGFNALTGETGAGKSIVIDALSAVLGQRTSRELIRTGADKAFVSAVFSGIDAAAEQLGIAPEEDGSLLLQREIGSDGKSTCRVNGRPVTVGQLKALGSRLLNIHGQHDGQQLLDEEQHLVFLDSFGNLETLISAYAEKYNTFTDIQRKIQSLEMDESEKARRVDTLTYQINELERAKLRPGEEEELSARRNLLRNAEKFISAVSEADYALNGDDSGDGALGLLRRAQDAVGAVRHLDDDYARLYERMEALYSEAYDVAATIEDKREGFDFSPNELDDVESRMDQLYRLKKKYGPSVEDMLAYLERCRAELEQMEQPVPVRPEAQPDAPLRRIRAALQRRSFRAAIGSVLAALCALAMIFWMGTARVPATTEQAHFWTYNRKENGADICILEVQGEGVWLDMEGTFSWGKPQITVRAMRYRFPGVHRVLTALVGSDRSTVWVMVSRTQLLTVDCADQTLYYRDGQLVDRYIVQENPDGTFDYAYGTDQEYGIDYKKG